MFMNMNIRVATVDDAQQALDIYAPFCLSSPVSFETEPPTLEEMRHRIAKTLEFFPWLIAEDHARCSGTPTPAAIASVPRIAGRRTCQRMFAKTHGAKVWAGRSIPHYSRFCDCRAFTTFWLESRCRTRRAWRCMRRWG